MEAFMLNMKERTPSVLKFVFKSGGYHSDDMEV